LVAVGLVKEILVILLVATILIPIGMNFYAGADTSNFTGVQKNIWDNIPTICFVVLILAIVGLISSGMVKLHKGKLKVYRQTL